MIASRSPWRVALLPYLLGDNEPLVGDLVEEWPRRSTAWFWRQVLFAVSARAMAGASATLREPQRLSGALGSAAILLILSFQVVVAGSLLGDMIQQVGRAQATRIDNPGWLVFVVLWSLPVAWLIGRAMSRLHQRSRVVTVVVGGASAAVVGALTVSLLSATGSFFSSVPLQTAAGMVFVLGLLIGSSSRSALGGQA